MSNEKSDTIAKWTRRLARGLSLALAGGWLFIGIASAFGEPEPPTWEGWFVVGAIITAVILTAVAWWNARIGGTLLVVFGQVFSLFGYISAGHNKWFAVLVSGVPFIIVGALFLASWWAKNLPPDSDLTLHFEP